MAARGGARLGRLYGKLLALALLAAVAVPVAGAARPLRTAVLDGAFTDPAQADLAFARTRSLGARAVRFDLGWPNVATRRPANPTHPDDPAYRWEPYDRVIRLAVARGLEPILGIMGAPEWAQGRGRRQIGFAFRPDPVAYGQFARAAATRYSGSFRGLPRVRYWQAWNEPNANWYLEPQIVGRRLVSPAWYRSMVNRLALAVHAVHPTNSVIAGGLSPFTVRRGRTIAIGPLRFMRSMLCLSGGRRPRPTCAARARFDIWSHHPYTSGGPTRHAFHRDDVSLGDLPEMRRLLTAAVRARRIVSSQRVRFWVTEFSWDTRPPDPKAMPVGLHGRWVAEALYQMWRSGVELVTWFTLRDGAYPESPAQSGLFFRGRTFLRDQPKPAAVAFRFPFVAYRERRAVRVWGRTPGQRAGRVVIERRVGRRWQRLASLRANGHGIFARRVSLRARRRASVAPVRFAAASRYRDAVLADSPSSYWRFGERAGSRAAADERGARPGSYVGSPRLGVAGAIVGDSDRAAFLDGRNDRVALGPISSPRTIEAWIRTLRPQVAGVFSNRNAINHFSFLGVEQSGNALAFDSGGVIGSRWITDDKWHHVVSTYDRGVLRLYVDGLLDEQASILRLEGSAPAVIGYDASLRRHFRGYIDEVALYDHALSAARVKAHWDASGRRPSTLEQFQLRGKGPFLRARVAGVSGAVSLPFSLVRPADRWVNPFGGGGGG